MPRAGCPANGLVSAACRRRRHLRASRRRGSASGGLLNSSRFGSLWQDALMRFLLRVLISAVALWVATELVSGIVVRTHHTSSKVLTLIVVALIFGVVNAVLKPIVKTVGCVFYIVTLGLIGLVVNGLLLWLTSWVAGKLSVPFHITGFWPAFWGAIIVGVVGWLLGILVRDPVKPESGPGSSPA